MRPQTLLPILSNVARLPVILSWGEINMYWCCFKIYKHTLTLQYEEHYDDVIMIMLASQITSLTVVYSTVYSDVNQRKHQSSASLAFVWEIHRGPVNFPHKGPVTRKMFPFDDVIMKLLSYLNGLLRWGQRSYQNTFLWQWLIEFCCHFWWDPRKAHTP